MASRMNKKELMIAQRTYEANKQKQETKNVRKHIFVFVYACLYGYIYV
jgi:hypothetical protein